MIDQIYKWYPIYTRPKAEKKAYLELCRKNIKTYLPLKDELRQWSDRKKWVKTPLLTSYLFVHISNREYQEVLETNGVCRFIYFSGEISSIPDRQITDLQRLIDVEKDLEIIDINLLAGEHVLINAGPFQGMIAELVSIQNKKQLVLRFTNLGYAVQIKTSVAFITPIN